MDQENIVLFDVVMRIPLNDVLLKSRRVSLQIYDLYERNSPPSPHRQLLSSTWLKPSVCARMDVRRLHSFNKASSNQIGFSRSKFRISHFSRITMQKPSRFHSFSLWPGATYRIYHFIYFIEGTNFS